VRVGIEYAADAYSAAIDPRALAGVATSIKLTDLAWSSVEALPGLSRPSYNWRGLDAEIERWARVGIAVDCIVLRCQHWLATAPTYASRGGPLSSEPPKSARMWDAWGRLAGALAAHLRGLGIALEIESEADRLWDGSVDEYLRLLAIAYQAIKAADADATVVLAGVSPGALLDDDPDDDEIGARIMALAEPQRSAVARALDFYERTLREGRYDVAEIHSLYSASGIAPAVRRVRALGARRVWIGDSFPSASVCWSPPGWNQQPKPEMDARLLALERGDVGAREALYDEQMDTTHERILEAEAAGCEVLGVGPIMRWPMVWGQPWQSLLDDAGKPLPVCDVIAAAQ
jgi:hypothetical protein